MLNFIFRKESQANSFEDMVKLYLIDQGLDARDVVSGSFLPANEEYIVTIDDELAEANGKQMEFLRKKYSGISQV